MFRRSQRLIEKKLKLEHSLPENEICSDIEADEDADSDSSDEENEVKGVQFDSGSEDEDMDMVESDEEAEEIDDENVWSQNTSDMDGIEEPFDRVASVAGEFGENEIDYFEKIWDEAICTEIVNQTNIYADQKQSKNWDAIALDEFKATIGMFILMGIHKLPSLKCYWSSDEILRVEAVAKVMTLNRYRKIIENLHCNDNTNIFIKTHPKHDKLHKVRPILDMLNANIGKVYNPSSFYCVDESMIAFKGRCVLKQFMPMKPIKRGYKVWCLADSTTGFIIAFIIYTGKEEIILNSTLGERVVLNFAEKIKPGSIVVVDNFFTSVSLLDNLRQQDIYACGTVRSNSKGLPPFMKKDAKTEKSMNRGEFQFQVKNGIAAVKWKDNKAVNFLSSAHSPRQTSTVLRRLRNGKRIEVPCPQVVKVYNRAMGGVDKFDQLHERYAVGRKSMKWWHRIFYYLVDLAIVNSFVLWKMQQPVQMQSKTDQLTYRLKLARQLIGGYCGRKNPGRTPHLFRKSVPNEVRLAGVGLHMPVTHKNNRRCKSCSAKKIEKRTRITCSSCKVPLCAECFQKFHK